MAQPAATAPGAHTVIENVRGERTYINPPDYVDDDAIRLTDNSRKVLERRYLRRDLDGALLETPAGMFYRVAYHVAAVEDQHGRDSAQAARAFYDLLSQYRFFPNSPTFTGAGTPLGQLAACFVLPIADDMGKSGDGIFSTLRVAALHPADRRRQRLRLQPFAPQGRRRAHLIRPGDRPRRLFARLRPGLRRNRPGRHATGPTWACCASIIPTSRNSSSAKPSKAPSPTSTSPSPSPTNSCRPCATTPISTCATRATAPCGKPCAPVTSSPKIIRFAHHNGEPGALLHRRSQPQQPGPAPLRPRSHQSLWRTVAWPL